MNQKRPVSVLIAPLDWGLGHATRCIPIIKELIQQGTRVIIAASGLQKNLLREEFPYLEFIEIPGYEIRYKRGFLLKWTLVIMIPAILKKIKKENEWLEGILKDCKIDAVISDNRYGLFHKKLYCVFITHQLYIESGWGSREFAGGWSRYVAGAVGRWVNDKILRWNYRLVRKFSVCWVPDLHGTPSLAGKLSHPAILPPIPVKYIGVLSRFKKEEKKIIHNSLLILISGPEPQRTEFENLFLVQLVGVSYHAVLVRGLPGSQHSIPHIREGLKIYNHLPSEEMNELLNRSEYIIARSGYSTIMDLVNKKRNAILVPTPGQTEQEYLGRYMHERKWMFSVPQRKFNIENVLSEFKKADLVTPEMPNSLLSNTIREFLEMVN
jgi:UDP:flavonoid glycosyltransferase YjiC (YdhE family)